MNDATLKKGIQATLWESYYRKRDQDQYARHFLSPTADLDFDFEKHLDALGISAVKALDIGTGTGEQAIFLAKKGFEVTATDVSETALAVASQLAVAHQVNIAFVKDSILMTGLEVLFDLIIDRGCFTILPEGYEQDYFTAVKKLLHLNGWLFLKMDKKNDKRLSVFLDDNDFKVCSIEASSYVSLKDKMVPATLLILQKIR